MLNEPKFIHVWKEYKEMRKAKKKPLTKNAENRQLTKINKLYNALNNDLDKVISHMEIVCNSCWDNVYTDKEHLNKIIDSFNITNHEPIRNKQKFTFGKESEYNIVANNLQEIMHRTDFIAEVNKGF